MATTPIYNWSIPDNTDLVKNGALAIRTLGDAIDTTMATMTPKSLVDAKGDLIAASAADTPARLAVGNNGETLVADSSTSTGLRYTAGTVQANPVLNSAMQCWQRGTSITSGTGVYTADRWLAYRAGATSTISRQATGDTTNLPNIQYCLRFQRNSGTAVTGFSYLSQSFESINSIPFAGKTVTYSFYARAGANFSAPSSQIVAKLATGTGTDQNVITGTYTGIITAINQTVTLSTTWQRFTATATLSASLTELAPYFEWDSVGTAGANDYVEITGVQIDIGSVALPFRTYAGTIQGELAACQRYYTRTTGFSGTRYCTGFYENTTNFVAYLKSTVTMRGTPTAIDYSNVNTYDNTAFIAVSALTLVNATPDAFVINCTVSGATQFRPGILTGSGTPSFIGFSAEL